MKSAKPKLYLVRLILLCKLVLLPLCLEASPLVSFGDSVNVHALFGTQVRYTSNIYNNHEGVADDLIFTASPGLEVTFGEGGRARGNKFEGSLTMVEDIEIYTDNDELNGGLTRINLNGSYDVGSRLALQASAGFAEVSQNTGTENVQGALIRRHNYDFKLRAEYKMSDKTKFDTQFSLKTTNYRNFEDRFYNRDDYSLPFNVYYIYSKKVDFGLGYEFRLSNMYQTDPPGAFIRDRSSHYINVRAKGEIAKSVTGLTYVGVRFRRFHGSHTKEDLSFGTDIKWEVSSKLTLNAGLSRDTQSTGSGDSLTKTSGTAGAKYFFSDKITSGLSGTFSVDKFDNNSREQETFIVNWYTEYLYSQYTSYLLGYSYFNNDSTATASNYHNHTFNARVNVKY